MHHSSNSRSSKPFSSRSKNSSSSYSGSAHGRSSYRSRSRSPRSRRWSNSRSSRRSPPSRRSSRGWSPGKHPQSPSKCCPSLGDVNRDDLTDGLVLNRGLSCRRSPERYRSCKENPSSPFNRKHDEDYRSRDVFFYQSDYSMKYSHLQALLRETDKKSSYTSEEKGQEPKCPEYDRDDRWLDMGIESQGFLSRTQNYCKQNSSRSPSLSCLDEDLRELEFARRKSEEEKLSRNFSQDLMQSPEIQYLLRPDEAPAIPKKSILKKHVDNLSMQPGVFSKSSASVKELPLLLDHPPVPQCRGSVAPFSSEEENNLKRFNKSAVVGSASKTSQGSVHGWKLQADHQQSTSPCERNFGDFFKQKEFCESPSAPDDCHSDFLLPHERASQDGSGFSCILGMTADSTNTHEKRRHSFFDDIEDEEKFLYGDDDDDDDSVIQRITLSSGKEPGSKEASTSPSAKLGTAEETRPEYDKIHDLLKIIGLDIGVAEIDKLAARTQERLHGKKTSCSPEQHSVASHKPEPRKRHQSDTHSPESRQNRSFSPSSSFPPSKEMSFVSNSEHNKSKTVGQDYLAPTPEVSVPTASPVPSAPPCLPHFFPPPTISQYSVPPYLPFSATQLPQNYPPPTMPPPGYYPYGQYLACSAPGWPMYAPPQQTNPALSKVPEHNTLRVPPNPSLSNIRVIKTVSTRQRTSKSNKKKSVPVLLQPSLKCAKERTADDRNRASQKQKVLEEREKLKAEQEARQKKLYYLTVELNRLSKQQGKMLQQKRKEEDPLLVEVNHLREKLAKEVDQLKSSVDAAEKKQSELDKVAQILGIKTFEKSQKESLEHKDSLEADKSENSKHKNLIMIK